MVRGFIGRSCLLLNVLMSFFPSYHFLCVFVQSKKTGVQNGIRQITTDCHEQGKHLELRNSKCKHLYEMTNFSKTKESCSSIVVGPHIFSF